MVLVRRLIVAGVSVLTVDVHNWDTHQHNFSSLRETLQVLDRAIYAFVIGKPNGMKSVLATIYSVLGIDTAATIPDHNGRPQFVLDECETLSALL